MTSDHRPMRLAVAGLFHETNTYAVKSMGLTPLTAFSEEIGPEIARIYAGTGHAIGGFIEGAARHGAILEHTYFAHFVPSATIEASAYAEMKRKLIAALGAVLPVDGVLVALHGAAVAEDVDDIEGDLLAAIRARVGPNIPITAVYDLHGNMTEVMRSNCNLTLPCKLYPHTDLDERGIEAVEWLIQTIRGELRPVTCIRELPMLAHLIGTQEGIVTVKINALCSEIAAREGMIECSWFHGFPYADIAAPCPVVVCTTDNDATLAQQCADEVASWIWDHREAFAQRIVSPTEAVEQALASPSGPIIINERSDNPGGGTPGDATHLLRAILDASPPPGTSCMAMINDGAVVEQAIRAGVGATINVALGGKQGPLQGKPIEAEAYVKAITDGQIVNRPTSAFGGVCFNLGKTCRLQIKGVDVIVTSTPQQVFDVEPFLLHGIDVMQRQLVGLKSANHFRAGFDPLAVRIIPVDAEGLSSTDVSLFPRQHLGRPCWPVAVDAKL